jgi:hypothetical protein
VSVPSYKRHRFPAEIIAHAVWLYYRFALSFRDIEELLASRGVTVSYEAIRLWCGKFGPEYARKLRQCRRRLGRCWQPINSCIRKEVSVELQYSSATHDAKVATRTNHNNIIRQKLVQILRSGPQSSSYLKL